MLEVDVGDEESTAPAANAVDATVVVRSKMNAACVESAMRLCGKVTKASRRFLAASDVKKIKLRGTLKAQTKEKYHAVRPTIISRTLNL